MTGNSAADEILEPQQVICDPHHHLWDYPQSMYLVDEFLTDVGTGHRLTKTVYVECQRRYRSDGPEHLRPVGETEFIEGIASVSDTEMGRPAVAAAIIGFADLRLGSAVDEVLQAHLRASRRFRGIRYMTAWHASDQLHNAQTRPPAKLLSDATFLEGFACLEKHALSFDAWVYHTQIDEVVQLARTFPGVSIILNHIGGPIGIGPYAGKREAVFAEWQAAINRLAAEANVVVKLGGLTMALAGFGWNKREIKPAYPELAEHMGPWYRACIDAFGVERCMFESNFPIDRVSCSYSVLWNAFKYLARDFGDSGLAALCHDTATRVYRI